MIMSITTHSMSELEDPKDVLLRHINNMPGIRYRELSEVSEFMSLFVRYIT
jgi:hypothetical protein